jgi:hypothetical protein
VSGVDVVEVVFGLKPWRLEIVDGEFNVGWDPGGLNWAQVNSGDGGAGVLIADWNEWSVSIHLR